MNLVRKNIPRQILAYLDPFFPLLHLSKLQHLFLPVQTTIKSIKSLQNNFTVPCFMQQFNLLQGKPA